MNIDTTVALRLSKAVLVAAAAAWSLLAAVDNVFDYASNFQFVRHVLEMDTTFPGNAGMWRAVRLPILHHVAYALIIVTECAVGVLAGIGALRMAAARHNAQQFRRAKLAAIVGLTLGMLLWLLGFEVIAGEWFMMWQSRTWNAQDAAFRYVVVLGICLIYVSLEDPSSDI